ncbi:hypothetical protein Trydic_g2582 [Trypoxylus dichotomus]
MASNPITEHETAEHMRDNIKTNVIASAEEALATRKVNINGQRNKDQWFINEVKVLAEQKKEAHVKYRSRGTEEIPMSE